MKKKTKKILRKIGGVSLIIIGIVGLVLPILQGVLLIGLGIYLVSPKMYKKIKMKFKKK